MQGDVKRMCLSTEGTFQSLSFHLILSCLFSLVDLSFGRISRGHELWLWCRPPRTNKQSLSIQGVLASLSTQTRLLFLPLPLSVSLYCWWKAAETTWLSCWWEKRRQAERDTNCHGKGQKDQAGLSEGLFCAHVWETFHGARSCAQKLKLDKRWLCSWRGLRVYSVTEVSFNSEEWVSKNTSWPVTASVKRCTRQQKEQSKF